MTLYERCVRFALRAYKLTLSPLIGRQCRYLPTCSEYAAEALIAHGPWRGARLADRAAVPMPSLWRVGIRPAAARACGKDRRR